MNMRSTSALSLIVASLMARPMVRRGGRIKTGYQLTQTQKQARNRKRRRKARKAKR